MTKIIYPEGEDGQRTIKEYINDLINDEDVMIESAELEAYDAETGCIKIFYKILE